MALNPLKAFLFAAGGSAAAATAAYVSGALDPYLGSVQQPPASIASLPDPAASKGDKLPAPATVDAAAAPAAPAETQVASAPAEQAPAAPDPARFAPSFDVVRVEADGSVVIAGKAVPQALVEVLTGESVIGSAKASADGDFAVVFDNPLKPGDYQLFLRSTSVANEVLKSLQSAVISIPEKKDGQVLAMVEEPGQPSKVLTAPLPAAPEPVEAKAPDAPPPAVVAPAEPKAAAADPVQPAIAPKITVDAVEIEGRKIFVAGVADAGARVRVYANDVVLGEAVSSPAGRFLVEAEHDLAVGSYVVRADVIGPDGATVLARAAVPFEREPGEAIAAVAPNPSAPAAVVAAAEPAATPAPAEAPATAPVVVAQEPAPAVVADKPAAPAVVAAAEPPASDPASPGTAAPETLSPKLQSVDGAVIIRRGDSLWRISRRVYGHGVRFSTIYLANQDQISDPDRIWPGQVFSVPDKTAEGDAADMKAVGDQATTKAQ